MKFINYFANTSRASPLNLLIARSFFGLYAIWKFGTQADWTTLIGWPVRITDFTSFLVPPDPIADLIVVEYWLTLLFLVLFTLGIRVGATGFLSSLFIAHMSGALYTVANSGTTETFIPVSFILMIFAVYRSDIVLSVDHYHQLRSTSLDRLTTRLERESEDEYRMTPLKWILVAVGVFYFLTGIAKVTDGSAIQWATAESMNRYMQRAVVRGYENPLLDLFVSYPFISELSAIGSMVLELGFLVAIVAGLGISLFVAGLFIFHTGIAVALTPFFFDQYFALLLFFSWDSLHQRFSTTADIELVYDDHCHFCTRVLLLFDHFDLNETITYHPISEVPERLLEEGYDFEDAMYVFAGEESYRGYHAFRYLFSQFGVLRPMGALMRFPVIRHVGERVYGHVADNRSRYFYCDPVSDERASEND